MIDGLKGAGMTVLIVFHDPHPFGGRRWRDRLRRRVQLAVMRRAARVTDKIVSTVSPDCVHWMQDQTIRAKTLFLPVGSNLPVTQRKAQRSGNGIPVVVVFGFSNLASEISVIASALSRAAEIVGPLHLTVFGHGAKVAGTLLRPSLANSPVELGDFGVLEPEKASSLRLPTQADCLRVCRH
jgi:hypothetical protein